VLRDGRLWCNECSQIEPRQTVWPTYHFDHRNDQNNQLSGATWKKKKAGEVGIAAEGAREADVALEGRRVDTDAANDSRFWIELVQKRIRSPKLIESTRLRQRYGLVPEVGVAAEVRREADVVRHERGVDGGEACFLPGDAVVACWGLGLRI